MNTLIVTGAVLPPREVKGTLASSGRVQPNPATRDASPEQNSIPDPKPQPDISQASDVASIKGDDLEHEPVAWASVALAEKMHGEAHHDEQQGN